MRHFFITMTYSCIVSSKRDGNQCFFFQVKPKLASEQVTNDLKADIDCLEAEVSLLRNENKALKDRRKTLEHRIQTVSDIVEKEQFY